MLRNYLRVALRNLVQHKVYALINVLSLAIGITTCLIIFLFITDELSFDSFHQQEDRIYRLNEVQSFTGMSPQNVALSMPGMGPSLLREMPEVESFARFWVWSNMLYQQGDQRLIIERTAMVDATFLSLFDFELTEGAQTALDEPNSIVLTETLAQKLFGEEGAVGQQLVVDDKNYSVTGLLADVPENSHLQYDALTSMSTHLQEQAEFDDQWGSNFLVTYLLLAPQTDIADVEDKFPEFLVSHMGEDATDFYTLFLQPLSDVHLGSTEIEHDYHNYRKFDGAYINTFFVLALFVLIIASINFMNLSVARSTTRSKEVGIRKAIGALKQQLVGQFLGESVLLTLIALVFSVVMVALFLPYLNTVTDRSLSLVTIFDHAEVLVGMLLIVTLVGVLSGFYPAFFLSSFQPAKVLKGKLSGLNQKSALRSALVVVQFATAIALIVGTVLATQQLDFMKNKDVGFNKDQMMLIPMNGTANKQYETLKNELLAQTGVVGVTASGQRIGNNFHQTGMKVKTDTAVRNLTASQVNVDYDYLDVYDIAVQQGRTFSRDYATDPDFGFIVNEALVQELGLDNPVGTQFGFGWYSDDTLGTIIGTTSDFNFNSLHHSVNTLVMYMSPDRSFDELSVKINPRDVNASIQAVQATWEQLVPDRPFEYAFLDEHFESLYEADEQR